MSNETETVEAAATEVQTEQTAPAQEQPGLTVNDLALMVQVIQLATSRSAFKAEELSAVGGLFDRVSKFLAAVAPKPEGKE